MDDDELDEIAEELYGVPPEEFVEARTAARDRAKATDKELAKAVAALPKPTTAAWVCNLLVRRQPDEVAQLREIGEMLRRAQVGLSGDELRQLGRQRNQVVAALARQARGLAHAEGHDVSSAVAEQVESTLRAAVVDPDAGEALAGGRLTTALSYSGLGPVDLSGAVATPVRSGAAPRAKAATPAPQGPDAAELRRQEAEERRRQELEQARRDAEEAAAVARDAAASAQAAEQELTEAGERRDQLHERAEQLEKELRRVEREAKEAVGAVHEAEKRRDAAARRAATAAAIRDRSAARVEELAASGG
ncbi:hypothetical protein [Modestobacter versicolor]|uniref:Uncharacterized protein n=1 Tax=Modestobacter versicolor TaxID=429133 RepID=A0A323VD70_9ACTN|nr:hypothetical protein [Modestobacter versicolor]MBB3674269.1 hypothetical protein [Modestobacter versicolor]MBB3678270.1 hypothetical protein [Modestobacter versicolor]PZA21186.1 hypothetical protein DMO24_11615 [Modestobacter versicolor]